MKTISVRQVLSIFERARIKAVDQGNEVLAHAIDQFTDSIADFPMDEQMDLAEALVVFGTDVQEVTDSYHTK